MSENKVLTGNEPWVIDMIEKHKIVIDELIELAVEGYLSHHEKNQILYVIRMLNEQHIKNIITTRGIPF